MKQRKGRRQPNGILSLAFVLGDVDVEISGRIYDGKKEGKKFRYDGNKVIDKNDNTSDVCSASAIFHSLRNMRDDKNEWKKSEERKK